MHFRPFLWVALLTLGLLTGCAPEALPQLSADHPANPSAAEAPVEGPGPTLAAGPPASQPAASQPDGMDDSSHHMHHHH